MKICVITSIHDRAGRPGPGGRPVWPARQCRAGRQARLARPAGRSAGQSAGPGRPADRPGVCVCVWLCFVDVCVCARALVLSRACSRTSDNNW